VLSKQLRLEPAQLTDVGRKRPHNEDNMAYVIPKDATAMAKKGALFIVADGMGGHAAGEVASEIAVDTVSKAYYQDDSEDVIVSLVRAIKRANTLIHQRAAENMLRSGMGTTCVAAVLRGGTAYIANVGDSRAYFIHNGQVRQVSQDHSWVAEQVRAGLLTEEQARSHAQRNVITRSLGTQPDVEVDVFTEQLEEGDFLVLCSDGLSGLISDDDLRTIVNQYQPQESVYHLVERANENGGPDNITVIVARVQEVGSEPPSSRPTGRVAGRDLDEATMPLAFAGVPLGASSLGPATVGTGRLPSGPLATPDMATEPQLVLPPTRPKRSRLLYPTLALFILLVIALVAGAAYYLLLGSNASNTLASASAALKQAKAEVSTTPADALKKLATVQTLLHQIQDNSLNDTQSEQLSQLQTSFVATVKTAITNYTSQSGITTLPCPTTLTKPLNTGSTNAQVTSIASVTGPNGTLYSYALGNNGQLYQINSDSSLVNPLRTTGTILKIASDGSRLLALTEQPGTTPSYSVHLLLPNASGALQDANASNINPTLLTPDTGTPSFITAWGTDVYVVLTSTAAAAQNNATILGFTVAPDNKLVPATNAKISISNAIVGVAAFMNHQLFLLYGDGSVQSWQAGSPAGVSVVVTQPIPVPLSVSAQDFTLSTPVPQVVAPSSVFLMFPRATLLGAGSEGKVPHLYIEDAMYHRILDLQAVAPSASISVTPTTPTPTANANAPGGGVAVANNQVRMQLVHQYTSTSTLANVSSIVADPSQAQLFLLTQSAQGNQGQGNAMQNVVTVNLNQNDACTP
jgi:serine/threonine protein phosphatase PrpC